jgi:hypothetical protein
MSVLHFAWLHSTIVVNQGSEGSQASGCLRGALSEAFRDVAGCLLGV